MDGLNSLHLFALLCYLYVKVDFAFTIHDPLATSIGAAQCLGELYRYFGRRITSGLFETTIIVTKLLKFNEVVEPNLVQCLSDLCSISCVDATAEFVHILFT